MPSNKNYTKIKEEYNKWHSVTISEYIDKKFYEWLKSQAEFTSKDVILDVGCGKGHWLNFLEYTRAYRVGVDISLVALKKAKRSSSIDYVLADAENLPFRESSFDKIFCLGSLEHFVNPKKGAMEIKKVLKNHGTSLIFLPNAYFLGHIYLVYKTGEPPDEGGQYFAETFATRKAWEKLLVSTGFRIVKCNKYNRISKASRKVSSHIRILYNIFIAPFVPMNLSYAFLFICTKQAEKTHENSNSQ
jgi:ubiquinone/menaquinone biosynthesis C-methylase UbiE